MGSRGKEAGVGNGAPGREGASLQGLSTGGWGASTIDGHLSGHVWIHQENPGRHLGRPWVVHAVSGCTADASPTGGTGVWGLPLLWTSARSKGCKRSSEQRRHKQPCPPEARFLCDPQSSGRLLLGVPVVTGLAVIHRRVTVGLQAGRSGHLGGMVGKARLVSLTVLKTNHTAISNSEDACLSQPFGLFMN